MSSKKVFIPMKCRVQIFKYNLPKTPKDKALMKKISYALAIGSIVYAMLCTKPDVTFAFSVMNKF